MPLSLCVVCCLLSVGVCCGADFKVLKYVRCKGDKPSPLSVNEKEIKPLKGKGKKDTTNR